MRDRIISWYCRRPGSARMRRLGLTAAMLLVLAGMLAACNSQAPAQTHSSTATVPGGQTGATATSSAMLTPSATVTAGPSIIQVNFSDQYSASACGGTSPSGTTCVSASGSGQDSALGDISLSRSAVYAPLGPDSCASATTQGTLTLAATGDTISFTGTGTFCGATQIADFTYTITGGTGAYQHASGSGTIHVPLPSSSSTGTEIWSGMLSMS